jgi:hypothetical protein
MNKNDQFQSAARSYEGRCDCCGNDPEAERLEALEEAIKADPSFIGEAIANVDLTQLVASYQSVDLQQCWDAIHDIIDAHYVEQLRYMAGDVDKLGAAHGVSL